MNNNSIRLCCRTGDKSYIFSVDCANFSIKGIFNNEDLLRDFLIRIPSNALGAEPLKQTWVNYQPEWKVAGSKVAIRDWLGVEIPTYDSIDTAATLQISDVKFERFGLTIYVFVSDMSDIKNSKGSN